MKRGQLNIISGNVREKEHLIVQREGGGRKKDGLSEQRRMRKKSYKRKEEMEDYKENRRGNGKEINKEGSFDDGKEWGNFAF